jgi:hypothetical protein
MRQLLGSTASVTPVPTPMPAPVETQVVPPPGNLPGEAKVAAVKPADVNPAAPKTGPPAIDVTRLPDFALVGREHAAVILGISVDTLKRLVKAGTGPPKIQISRKRVGYRICDLKAWAGARPPA